VEACKTKIEADLGPVDILVNNAGVLPLASLREGKPSDLERIITVNLTAHLWVGAWCCCAAKLEFFSWFQFVFFHRQTVSS
jgi:NAD(P)-dependent dehydrogenase (short-subunit alcohol dehydrogenase family)